MKVSSITFISADLTWLSDLRKDLVDLDQLAKGNNHDRVADLNISSLLSPFLMNLEAGLAVSGEMFPEVVCRELAVSSSSTTQKFRLFEV